MPEEWLIDGYNLLHAITAVCKQKQVKMDREILLAQLSSFAANKNVRLTVVLDGQGNQSELGSLNTSLFEVAYSQKVSADTYIERVLFERRALVKLVVVTNDRAISNIARGGGASVFGCDDFMMQLKDSKDETSKIQQKNDIRSRGFNRPFDEKLSKF